MSGVITHFSLHSSVRQAIMLLFITNQFLPKAKQAVYDFSGGFFLNHPELSSAMFDSRNSQLYRFDRGLLDDYVRIKSNIIRSITLLSSIYSDSMSLINSVIRATVIISRLMIMRKSVLTSMVNSVVSWLITIMPSYIMTPSWMLSLVVLRIKRLSLSICLTTEKNALRVIEVLFVVNIQQLLIMT